MNINMIVPLSFGLCCVGLDIMMIKKLNILTVDPQIFPSPQAEGRNILK